MSSELESFISKAREKNWPDDAIRSKLLAGGWEDGQISAALGDDLLVPTPPSGGFHQASSDSAAPLSKTEETVKIKIFDYNMMFVTLWIAAISTFVMINALLFGTEGSLFKFPLTALIVSAPVFLVLFTRVRKLEVQDPQIKHVAARLHLIQATQNLAFIIILLHSIFALYQVISGSKTAFQQVISWLATLIIFGSIFIYYWSDTHKSSAAR